MNILHLIGPAPYCTNSYILCSEKGNAIVIDPSADVKLYLKAFEKNNLKLTYILLTHGHLDHTYCVDELQKATGCKIIAAKEDLIGDRMYPIDHADIFLEDECTVELDEIRLVCWHTPGHSPGSYVFFCESENLFFTGDTLFAGSIGRTDLEGGNYSDMEKSLRRLMELPVPDDAQVLPGHNEFSTLGKEKQTNWFLQF